MEKTVSFDKRIYELRKLVSILEWDIPNIKNNELRGVREAQLMKCKVELQMLLERRAEVEIIQ